MLNILACVLQTGENFHLIAAILASQLTMISASGWVPRGFASEFPEKYELDDSEMERIQAMARLQLAENDESVPEGENSEAESGAEPPLPAKLGSQADIDDDLKEYDLENYDNDGESGEQATMFPGMEATIQDKGEEGTFLTLPTEEDLQEEKQESQIYPTDNLVLATRTEDDISYLDVYVYDDGAGAPDGATEEEEDKFDQDVANGLVRESSLYVHHDLMLPAFPLCVEWINFRPNSADLVGNFAAIGTFDPQIEVWNLDCIDKAFPDMILGEPESNSLAGVSKKSKKKKKKSQHVTTHHTDAVLSLAHNQNQRSVLASSSADHTVKLWDLNAGTAVRSFNQIHANKTVSSSQWHSEESSILLTGGYDGTCAVSDVRISDENKVSRNYKVSPGEEVENVAWGATPELFYGGTDSGNVYCFDVRVTEKPLWTLHAHDAGISSLSVNKNVHGMLATSAMGEKTVKLWRSPEPEKGPSMVLSRDFGLGNVLTSSFAPDMEVAGLLSVGGVSGALKVWDVLSNRTVRSSFRDELAALKTRARTAAMAHGRASRIARKYTGEVADDTIMTVEAGGLDDESDSDEEVEEGDEE